MTMTSDGGAMKDACFQELIDDIKASAIDKWGENYSIDRAVRDFRREVSGEVIDAEKTFKKLDHQHLKIEDQVRTRKIYYEVLDALHDKREAIQ